MLNIFPTSQKERALIFIKTLLNNTNKVTKVADQSVLEGIAQGVSKISGKAEKDILLALSNLYPDNTYGDNLDVCADIFGVPARFGASGSSCYVRLVGDNGTVYLANTNSLISKDGIQFQFEENVSIGVHGYTYAKVRSVDTGEKTNVKAGSINDVSPRPVGHKYVTNEYKALYGRDVESDDLFRKRIKEGSNILARGTVSSIEQAFMKINTNVLSVFYQGLDNQAKLKLAIVTQNGINLNQSELDELLEKAGDFLSLSSLKPFGTQSYGIVLSNIQWQPLDISFRVDLFSNFNSDDVRAEIQLRVAKYLDFRKWKAGSQNIEWDNLLEIVKNTPGVKYVPDQYFYPNNDIKTDRNRLPRLRGMILLDLNGNILSGVTNQFNPVYYPQQPDFIYQQTVLASI